MQIQSYWKRSEFLTTLALSFVCCIRLAGAGEAPVETEKDVRTRFMQAYTGAAKPILRADAVLMLKGLHEDDSLRLISGLLGDSVPEVRRNACQVMSGVKDPSGQLVKPLTAALFDKDIQVRTFAAEALGHAQLKALASKALVQLLEETAGREHPDAKLVGTIHVALGKLSGVDMGKEIEVHDIAAKWRKWWDESKDALESSDDAYRAKLPPHEQE